MDHLHDELLRGIELLEERLDLSVSHKQCQSGDGEDLKLVSVLANYSQQDIDGVEAPEKVGYVAAASNERLESLTFGRRRGGSLARSGGGLNDSHRAAVKGPRRVRAPLACLSRVATAWGMPSRWWS